MSGETRPRPTTTRRGSPPRWLVFAGGGCAVVVLLLAAVVAYFFYVGLKGPETDVYAGNEVPSRFIDTMRQVGALEGGERLDYFYSDALTDIRDGFYFVSDRRVVVYKSDSDPALSAASFDEIVDVRLDRELSFFIDSRVTVELGNGGVIAFPLSSEHEGDVRFVQTVRRRIGGDGERVEAEP